MSSSDSDDIESSNFSIGRLQSQIQIYQNENHQLKKENISLKSKISTLQTEFESKTKLSEMKHKTEIEELQNKLNSSINQQNEIQRKLLKKQQQASISMSSELQELQDKVSNLTQEKEKLISKISNFEENLKKEKLYSSSKITAFSQQSNQLYSAASIYFGNIVNSHEDLMNLMKEKPQKVPDTTHQQLELTKRNKKLKNKVENLKEALKQCIKKEEETEEKMRKYEEEIAEEKEESMKKVSEISNECETLRERNEELENNVKNVQNKLENTIKAYELKSQKQQIVQQSQQPVIQKEYIVKSIDSELQEDLLNQISKLTKKVISKQKKLQVLANIIRENELRIQELEANNENQTLELENEQNKNEELENQLKEVLSTLQNMKESNEVCQMKELTNRKLRRQKIIIDDQTTEIQRLTKENERVNELNKSQKVTIQRMETELSLLNNQQANEVHDKHPDVKEVIAEPSIEWELCDDIPYEVEGRIKEITRNESLSLSSKMKMVIESIIKYFNGKISATSSETTELKRKLKRIEFSIQPFVEEITETALGRKVSFDALVESPETQSAIIKTVASNTRSPMEINSLQSKLTSAQTEIQELKKKLGKLKVANKQIESESSSSATSADLQRLKLENSELRHMLDEQRETTNNRIKEIKFGMITEYENVINQLKERCSKQKRTIEDLMRQLSGSPSLSTTL